MQELKACTFELAKAFEPEPDNGDINICPNKSTAIKAINAYENVCLSRNVLSLIFNLLPFLNPIMQVKSMVFTNGVSLF